MYIIIGESDQTLKNNSRDESSATLEITSTGAPSGNLKKTSTKEPSTTLKKNSTDEPSEKSNDYTGAIAGGITGTILFVIIVVVIVVLVQRKILKNQHDISLKVKSSCFKYTLSVKIVCLQIKSCVMNRLILLKTLINNILKWQSSRRDATNALTLI